MSRNPLNIISAQFRAVQRHWTRLKFFEYAGIAGSVVCVAFFAMEVCAASHVLTDPPLFIFLLSLLGIVALLSLPFILIFISITAPERTWLAKQLEKSCPGLLDRVNTLVFLDKQKRQPFKLRIERQAAQIIEINKVRSPLSRTPALISLGIFAALFLVNIAYERYYHPFALLLNPPPKPSTLASHGDNPLEMAAPKPTPTPTPLSWGEVRIVEPGRDLKLTKIDVVQLQIEMAASATLKEPEWITSVNGQPEVSHPLAKSSEPQYAVYQPILYLDELNVEDWDVVSYYAKVKASDALVYQSKVFFIEIKPFDDDVMKSFGKGDKGDEARSLFQELNDIIREQRGVMQSTYQFQTAVYPTPAQKDQDIYKLTTSEGDLALRTNHLYAKITSFMINQPITMLLDQLTQAETAMNHATDDLKGEVIPQAEQDERAALAALIASRKTFLKVATAMGDSLSSSDDDDDDMHDPDAKNSLKKLSQVTEMKDRQQAALDKLNQLKARQDALASDPRLATAQSEKNLKTQVDDLIAKNEDLFRDSQQAAQKFHQDAEAAEKQLNDAQSRELAHHFMDQAAGDLGNLQKTAEANHQMDRMAQAYALKKILDENSKQLGKEQQTPGSLSSEDKDALDRSAANAALSLKDIADKPNSGFKPDLSQALSQDKQSALQDSLNKLKNSQNGADSQKAASDAKASIDKMSQAFDKSTPGNTSLSGTNGEGGQNQGSAGGGSAGGEAGEESAQLAQVEKQIESLMLQPQSSDPTKQGEQKQELGQVMAQLDDLMKKDQTKTPVHDAVLDQMNEVKKAKDQMPVPAKELKRLLDSIEARSGEIADEKANQPPPGTITLIDDSKLPPGYRDRIHHYYQQLSNSR